MRPATTMTNDARTGKPHRHEAAAPPPPAIAGDKRHGAARARGGVPVLKTRGAAHFSVPPY